MLNVVKIEPKVDKATFACISSFAVWLLNLLPAFVVEESIIHDRSVSELAKTRSLKCCNIDRPNDTR